MLVLTRKPNQSIMIGDDVEVSVLSIMGEKVRLGIAAPRTVPVFRKEVYLEIQAERGEVTAPGTRRRDHVDAEIERLGSTSQQRSDAAAGRAQPIT
jgi:carbon storage regulator